jgi:hypothetical protein
MVFFQAITNSPEGLKVLREQDCPSDFRGKMGSDPLRRGCPKDKKSLKSENLDDPKEGCPLKN